MGEGAKATAVRDFSEDLATELSEAAVLSLLTAPIINEAGAVVGVVQLINALDDVGHPVPFGVDAEASVRQFAVQAARVIRWWPSEGASTRSPDPR